MPKLQLDRFHSPKGLVRQLDRRVADLNVFLIALAVGLAVLDVTCFTALRFDDALMNIGNRITATTTGANADDVAR
jgi:hypothetical protein